MVRQQNTGVVEAAQPCRIRLGAAVAAARIQPFAADEAGDAPRQVTIEQVVAAGLRMREQQAQVADLEEQLAEARGRLHAMRSAELPDLMSQAGTDRVGIPALGNRLPPCDLVVKPYVKAVIAADWPQERREAAFRWLEANQHDDVIGRSVSVAFKRGETTRARAVVDVLSEMGYAPSVKKDVPWNTLTSLVRQLVAEYHDRLERGLDADPVPLDLLGATVGHVAELKERGTAPRAVRK